MPTYDAYLASLSPKLWWKLADVSGTTSPADSSGNGYTATIANGSISFGQTSSEPIAGDTYATFTAAIIQNTSFPAIGTSAWTALGWCKPTSTSSRHDIIAAGSTGTSSEGFFLYVTSSGGLECDLTSVVGASGGTISTSAWNFCAVTYSGGTMTLYLNGSSVGTKGSLSPNIQADAYGGGQPTDTFPFTGGLASLAIFSGTALSSTQISNLYSYRSNTAVVYTNPIITAPIAVKRAAYYHHEPPAGWRHRRSGLLVRAS